MLQRLKIVAKLCFVRHKCALVLYKSSDIAGNLSDGLLIGTGVLLVGQDPRFHAQICLGLAVFTVPFKRAVASTAMMVIQVLIVRGCARLQVLT